ERRFAFLLRGADGPSGRRCCCGWCGRLAFPWRGPTEQSSYQGPAPGNGSTRFGALRFLSNRTQAAAATLPPAPTKCRENQHAFALRSRMPLRAEAGEALLAPTEEGLVAVGRVVPQEARAVGAAVGLGEPVNRERRARILEVRVSGGRGGVVNDVVAEPEPVLVHPGVDQARQRGALLVGHEVGVPGLSAKHRAVVGNHFDTQSGGVVIAHPVRAAARVVG